MIISKTREPSPEEFKILVDNTTAHLNEMAKKQSEYFLTRNAQLLEEDVLKMLKITALGTSFEGSIVKISGQRFPDIIDGKYYGVEVKSSKNDKWISIGGSINESTRVDKVERIYLTFGKPADPVEFRSRPYEDCLSDVVATHYPRYMIDMNLETGKTIFNKMNMSYDKLRATGNAVGEIIKYYKSQLKKGESLWWIDNGDVIEENVTPSMKVRLWSSLTKSEKVPLITSIIIFFPEIFGSSNKKYERAALWLASRHGIVSTSMRDSFSAGGTITIITDKGTFMDVPRIFGHIQDFTADIQLQLSFIDESILSEMWKTPDIDNNRMLQWISLVSENCKLKNCDSNLCEKIIKAIFGIQ